MSGPTRHCGEGCWSRIQDPSAGARVCSRRPTRRSLRGHDPGSGTGARTAAGVRARASWQKPVLSSSKSMPRRDLADIPRSTDSAIMWSACFRCVSQCNGAAAERWISDFVPKRHARKLCGVTFLYCKTVAITKASAQGGGQARFRELDSQQPNPRGGEEEGL